MVGQNLNLAVPASQVARLLLRCASDGEITPFPFLGQPPAELYERDRRNGPFKLTRAEVAECEMRGGGYVYRDGCYLKGTIYNGTRDVTITRVIVVVETDQWTREYTIDVQVKPLSTVPYSVYLCSYRLRYANPKVRLVTGLLANP
jgi:hypothetical protein